MLWWLMLGVGMVLALLGGAAVLQQWCDFRDARKMPPPGRLIEVEGRGIHVLEQGSGAPTVVFDSAMGSTCLSWERVQPEVARFASTLSYDRAGFGWSDPGTSPGDVRHNVSDLYRLLERVNAPAPFVLVGHSYGGFTMRQFAHQYPELVAGLVLIDAADPEQWIKLEGIDQRKIEGGAHLARRGVWLSRLGIARFVTWLGSTGALNLARKAASFLTKGMPRPTQDRLLTPLDQLSPATRRALKWFWTRPSFYQALASQIETVPQSAHEVNRTGPYGDLPLVVLAAPNRESRWLPVQEQMARLSRNGRYFLVEDSSHWIPLDRPELVVRFIEEMCQGITSKGLSANRGVRV